MYETKVYKIFFEQFVYMTQQAPPNSGGKVSRRDFLKLMAAAGTIMTFAPFVDWGKFLPNPAANVSERAKSSFQMDHKQMSKLFRLIIQKQLFIQDQKMRR